jgi:hypothetical protein
MFPFSALLLLRLLRFWTFVCKYWVSWAPKSWFWTKFSFRKNIINRVPKLPESTRRKQAIFNKGSLFYSHCGLCCEQPLALYGFEMFPLLYDLIGRRGAHFLPSVCLSAGAHQHFFTLTHVSREVPLWLSIDMEVNLVCISSATLPVLLLDIPMTTWSIFIIQCKDNQH